LFKGRSRQGGGGGRRGERKPPWMRRTGGLQNILGREPAEKKKSSFRREKTSGYLNFWVEKEPATHLQGEGIQMGERKKKRGGQWN